MTGEAVPVDVSTMPEVAQLAHEMARDGRPRVLREAGKDIAVLSLPRASASRRKPIRLVDTNSAPPVRYRSVTDMVRHQPVAPARTFTDQELKEAIADARVDAWLAKHR